MSKKVVGKNYIYFYNPKIKGWMKAKRLPNGRIKVVGKVSKAEVDKARG